MKFIVGLGNPGIKYKNNRHNVGFMFVDYLSNKLTKFGQLDESKVSLFKSKTFMNRSGEAVKKIIENWTVPAGRQELKIGNLIVVHDDLDIPLGKFKIQKATGPLLHGGITSIENHLGTKDFWRIRIGIDNRPVPRSPMGEVGTDGETYVLHDFTSEEMSLAQEVFSKIETRLKIEFLNTP